MDLQVDFARHEQRLLIQVVQGKSAKEIAVSLHLSVETVKAYSYRLSQKLGVDPRCLPWIAERVMGCLAS